jgi:hypothetical protein
MKIDFNTIVEDHKKLSQVNEALKESIDAIQKKFDTNMIEIIKVLDDNQKRHATAISEIAKVVESIINR